MKNLNIELEFAKNTIELYINRHIGRILFKTGDSCAPVVKDLIKKEMWHLANNLKKELFGMEPTRAPQTKPENKLGNDFLEL